MTTNSAIQQFYQNVLRRAPSDRELEDWNALMASQSMTEAQFLNAIVMSLEAQTYSAQVIRFYQGSFGRTPDNTGLENWVEQIRIGTATTSDLANGFVNSAEWTPRYGSTEVNSATLTGLYQNVLGRTPAASEVSAWIATGQSMSEVLIGFVNSAEYQTNVSRLTNELLTTAGNTETADIATVFDGLYCLCVEELDQTFALTTGTDFFVGVPFNDTFVGSISESTLTFNSEDILDGASGTNDVLLITNSGTHTADRTHTGTLSNLETIRVSNDNLSSYTTTLDTSDWSGTKNLGLSNSTASGKTVFTSLANLVEAEVLNGTGELTIEYESSVIAGFADTQVLRVSGMTAGTFVASGTEKLALTSSGNVNLLTLGSNNSFTEISVTGDANLTLNVSSLPVGKIDASAFEGDLVIHGLGSKAVTLTGGRGSDTLQGSAASDTLTGGAGHDIFTFGMPGNNNPETISDMDFGTVQSEGDVLNLASANLTFSGDFDTVVADTTLFDMDEDVVLITSQTFANVAALGAFYEIRSALTDSTDNDVVILWQETSGVLHLSVATGGAGSASNSDDNDEFTFTDLATLSGLTTTGIASVLDIGDFQVA